MYPYGPGRQSGWNQSGSMGGRVPTGPAAERFQQGPRPPFAPQARGAYPSNDRPYSNSGPRAQSYGGNGGAGLPARYVGNAAAGPSGAPRPQIGGYAPTGPPRRSDPARAPKAAPLVDEVKAAAKAAKKEKLKRQKLKRRLGRREGRGEAPKPRTKRLFRPKVPEDFDFDKNSCATYVGSVHEEEPGLNPVHMFRWNSYARIPTHGTKVYFRRKEPPALDTARIFGTIVSLVGWKDANSTRQVAIKPAVLATPLDQTELATLEVFLPQSLKHTSLLPDRFKQV